MRTLSPTLNFGLSSSPISSTHPTASSPPTTPLACLYSVDSSTVSNSITVPSSVLILIAILALSSKSNFRIIFGFVYLSAIVNECLVNHRHHFIDAKGFVVHDEISRFNLCHMNRPPVSAPSTFPKLLRNSATNTRQLHGSQRAILAFHVRQACNPRPACCTGLRSCWRL